MYIEAINSMKQITGKFIKISMAIAISVMASVTIVIAEIPTPINGKEEYLEKSIWIYHKMNWLEVVGISPPSRKFWKWRTQILHYEGFKFDFICYI